MRGKKKILVVGQTPPPYGGQALMTQRLVEAKFASVEILHVRMSFSESFLEVGKASWKKVMHILTITGQIWKHRIKNKNLVLYYMPAGPNKVPVIRDLLLLILVRPFFSQFIYHFRAAGVSEFIAKQSGFFQHLCKLAYGNPTVGIQLSSRNPADAQFFGAKSIYHIPNGLEDRHRPLSAINRKIEVKQNKRVRILFVGVLREDKGFSWLLRSLHLLRERGVMHFELYVMGEFSSHDYEQEVKADIQAFGLHQHITFLGVQVGDDKWNCFSKADFLCFPTFFDCESFGNVLVEAMMFELPVISSQWRGIPDIVTEEVGFLVPVKDQKALADKIQFLIENQDVRVSMGKKARERYLGNYTLNHYLNRMENVFASFN